MQHDTQDTHAQQEHGGAPPDHDGGNSHGSGGHGQPVVHIRVQTPRGLWSMTEPEIAPRRPEYAIGTQIAIVIEDARAVFKFVEQDSRYTLFLNGAQLAPDRTLVSYHIAEDTLLVLSVQGGNAGRR
jgi:hypothetical protein